MEESKVCAYAKCGKTFYRKDCPMAISWARKKYCSSTCCDKANKERCTAETSARRKAERAKFRELMKLRTEAEVRKSEANEKLSLLSGYHPAPIPEHLRERILARVLPSHLRDCVFEG